MAAVIPGGVFADSPALDGIISEDEYQYSASFENGAYHLYWVISGDEITFGIVAETEGWVAIGFEPANVMLDADMVFGWVEDGTPKIIDAYSTGIFGPHPPDTDLGGTDDITAFGGSEESGTTTIEFTRKRSTEDQYDKDIPGSGEMNIIWATGATDDYTVQHSRVGSGILDFSTGEFEETGDAGLWRFHAVFMTLGVVLLLIGTSMVYMKKKKNWFRLHKVFGFLGGVCAIIGLAIGAVMVEGNHFRVPHTYLGGTTLIMMFLSLALGIAWMSTKKKMKIRQIHVWISRLAILLLVISVISGLSHAGVF